MEHDLSAFLESFGHTGIYIVDRGSMEVYFENSTAQKYTRANRLGQPCYLVHGNASMCASCPLRNENRTSYAIREDLGMIFMIQALETTWQGRAAYAILVRKQKDIPRQNNMGAGTQQRMNRALHSSILSYCEINMRTLNSTMFLFSDHEGANTIFKPYAEQLAEHIEQHVHPDDRERVAEFLSREKLSAVSADSDGPKELSIRYRQNQLCGIPKVFESKAYFLRDELPHYVSIITVEVTKEDQKDMQLFLLKEVANNAQAVFRFNASRNECSCVSNMDETFSAFGTRLRSCKDLDQLRGFIIPHIYGAEKQRELRAFLEPSNLIDACKAGKKVLRCKTMFEMADGSYRWIQLGVNLAQSRTTGEVEGIVFSESIEDTVIKDNMIAQVINNDYDYIVLIDLLHGTGRAFTNSGRYHPLTTDNAEGYIEDYLRRSYIGDDLEAFLQANRLAYVRQILSNSPGMTCTIISRKRTAAFGTRREPIHIPTETSGISSSPAVITRMPLRNRTRPTAD